MHDYIETMILRDQAKEELYFETLAKKINKDKTPKRRKDEQNDKIEIQIDDVNHKYHLIYHS